MGLVGEWGGETFEDEEQQMGLAGVVCAKLSVWRHGKKEKEKEEGEKGEERAEAAYVRACYWFWD